MRAHVVRGLALGALLLPLAACGFGPDVSLQRLPKFSAGVGPSYDLKATFTEVLNLPSDAQVRIGPQIVGAVSSIGTKDFAAQLTLKIKDGVQLPVGTTAQVRFDNPLGDQYVLLSLPTQPGSTMLGPGEPLAASDTSSAPSVEDAFGALSTVLNGGGINQLQTIIQELNLSFDGNQQKIHDLLTQVDTAVTSLAQGKDAVVGALTAIDDLSRQLNAGSTTITAGIDELAPAIGVLAGENGELSNLLTNFSALSEVSNRVLQQSGQNAVEGAKALVPVLDQLIGVKQRINQDLLDLAEFNRVTSTKSPGDYLQVGLTLNVQLPDGGYTVSGTDRTTATAATSEQATRSLLQGGLR